MFFIAETIPGSLNLKPGIKHPSIGESILSLIKNAKSSIDIGSIYCSLLNDGTPTPSDQIGRSIYNELVRAAKRGIKIRFLLTKPNEQFQEPEAENLVKLCPKMITLGYLDLNKLTQHGGIQHMKCFIVDHESIYVGSANCDWRAYSEVAEIGIFGIKSGDAATCIQNFYNYLWHEIDTPSTTQKRTSCDYESTPNQGTFSFHKILAG
ncbi:Phospholipase D Z [Thelohanellus kitauei]|uniref:Phospholipase D Z n=1 Tax=Thelohanellus kitauei TaxID=669202 RepID=A0A0C2N785_THEKT|nr:Phospholipase D Z [Thelohanellus kitauei]